MMLDDPYDNTKIIRDVADEPDVKKFRTSLSALRERMLKWSRRDLNAMFWCCRSPWPRSAAIDSWDGTNAGPGGPRS